MKKNLVDKMNSPSVPIFDSNCITPGTQFMLHLTEALDFYIQYQLNEDTLWSGIEVILSGPDVPGEGEHKIMDFIRRSKSQPGMSKSQPRTYMTLWVQTRDAPVLLCGSSL